MSNLPPSREVDAVIERATMVTERVRAHAAAMHPNVHRARRAIRRAKRFAIITAAGMLTLMIIVSLWAGLIGPIGILSIPVLILAAVAVIFGAGVFSREREIAPRAVAEAPLPQIADRTTSWIDQQRLALPAPAANLADDIGRKIAALRPQLATLDNNTPEAWELRRLVGEELPNLVESYKRVPVNMRREERNGRVAERELIEGMQLLDDEIGTLARSIASVDMDRLSSQKRYLELRYKGDETAD